MKVRPRRRHLLAGLLTAATIVATTVMATSLNTSAPAGAQSIFGPDTCLYGFVWREATPTDRVCVTPLRRDIVASENALAAERRSPTGGPWGPDTCLDEFMWREAVPFDRVCVTLQSRDKVRHENNTLHDRRALDWYSQSIPPTKISSGTAEYHVSLELAYQGQFTFKGWLKNTRTLPVNYVVACSVPTLDGRLMTISTQGTLGKDETVNFMPLNGISAEIANHWHAIPRDQPLRCEAETNVSLGTVVNRIQQAEKIVTGILKVIAWF